MTKAYDTVFPSNHANKAHGVGYNSKGKHKVVVDGKVTAIYHVWRNMIRRCYDPKTQSKRVTYIGCSVDERWHDYQDFAEWCYSHEYCGMGYELDKDLLTPENKIYSPDTCCFVPQEVNLLLNNNSRARGIYPQGVSWDNKDKKYRAQIKLSGKTTRLGGFDCPNEAYKIYKAAKEANVKRIALEWQDRIADNVFQALMTWQLTD